MAWSDAARIASAEARAAKKQQTEKKSANARRSFKVSDKAKQDAGTRGEQMVAKALGGEPTKDNMPYDVLVKRGNKTYAVEVKTLVDQKNDKITMHPESLQRKLEWAKANKAVPYTVVVDSRPGAGDRIYARYGVGSFRIKGMTETTLAALPKFLK